MVECRKNSVSTKVHKKSITATVNNTLREANRMNNMRRVVNFNVEYNNNDIVLSGWTQQ